jgi:hypothetical protein
MHHQTMLIIDIIGFVAISNFMSINWRNLVCWCLKRYSILFNMIIFGVIVIINYSRFVFIFYNIWILMICLRNFDIFNVNSKLLCCRCSSYWSANWITFVVTWFLTIVNLFLYDKMLLIIYIFIALFSRDCIAFSLIKLYFLLNRESLIILNWNILIESFKFFFRLISWLFWIIDISLR